MTFFHKKYSSKDPEILKFLFYKKSDKFFYVINNHTCFSASSMLSSISAIYNFHVYCRGTRNKKITRRALEWTVYQSSRDKRQVFLEYLSIRGQWLYVANRA